MESPDLAPESRNRTESSCSTASDMDGIDLFPLTDLENNNSNNIKVRAYFILINHLLLYLWYVVSILLF